MNTPGGPAAAAQWSRASGADGVEVLLCRDATASDVTYCLPAAHRVARGTDGGPVVGLTLLLDGVPEPDETDISARVRQGVLSMDLTFDAAAPPAVPLYARDVATSLCRGERVLATARGSGPAARLGLAATLDEKDALAVVAALDGQGDDLELRTEITYRTVLQDAVVRLSGSWAAVYDAVVARYGPATTLPQVDLSTVLTALLAEKVLVCDPVTHVEAVGSLFATMARTVLFDADGALASRPAAQFDVALTKWASGVGGTGTVVLDDPLAAVLAAALADVDRSAVVRLASLAGEPVVRRPGAAAVAVPRHVRTSPGARADRDDGPGGQGLVRFALQASGALVPTAALLALPGIAPPDPHLQLQAAGARLIPLGRAGFTDLPFWRPPLVITPVGRSGPVVDSSGSLLQLLLPDVADKRKVWYVPQFELVRPTGADDAASGPFAFSFARQGVTAENQPGIDASITFRLVVVTPAGVADELARGGLQAEAVSTANATAALDLPFRDGNGVTRSQRFPAAVTRDGDTLTVTVALIDSWARLAYGALSQPGFQAQPPRLSVAWSFPAWVRLIGEGPVLAFGGKQALVGLHFATPTRADDGGGPALVFDATTTTLRSAQATVQFRVPPIGTVARPLLPVQPPLVAMRPTQPPISDPDRPLAPRPMPPVISDPDGPFAPRFVQREQLREVALDATLPCADFGACYVERRPEGTFAIGCQDALRLGQTPWHQYEEVTALADPAYRVFRSLQQPGRFVVLPARYVIARHPAGTPERAYRPAILLYAVLDPADPAANQVVVQATLQPDVPPYALFRLRSALTALAPAPVLTLACDIEGTPTFDWTLVDVPTVTVSAVPAPGGIAVAFTADLAHALLLRDLLTHEGVAGSLTLALPDGTTMRSALLVALSSLCGPADAGPVEATVDGARAQLVNRVERPVDVSDLLVATAGATTQRPVERRLAPGESAAVDLGALPGPVTACLPVYTVPPAAPAVLEEIRSFVEDVRTNVIFTDLVDHAAHGVARLGVRARLEGASGVQEVAMTGSPASGQAEFLLPLTEYLAHRVLTYQVSLTRTDGTTTDGSWLTWDLTTAGVVVALVWGALGLPAT
jgi:hypothetical protein